MPQNEKARVRRQANGIASSILEQHKLYLKFQEDGEPFVYDNEEFTDSRDLVDRIREEPLSIQVRDGWRSLADERGDPEEYEILLGTGGPAFRIVGRLDDNNEPETAVLEWQDWFLPWTPLKVSNAKREALLWYASLFWYGE